MSRLIFFLATMVCVWIQPITPFAQTSSIETTIARVQAHEEPRGFFIDPPNPVPFVQIMPTTLDNPGTRIFENNQRIGLDALKAGSRVAVTGTISGTRLIATEVKVLQKVRDIYFDGVIIDIQREGSHKGRIFLLEFGERVDPRAHVYLNGNDQGAGLRSVIDILNRTSDPVVVTLSNRNAFEENWQWGRIDVKVGTPQPVRTEDSKSVTYQLPGDPNDAVYIGESEHALREIPSVVPIAENTILRSEFRDGDITFDDIPLYARVAVNAQISGTTFIKSTITLTDLPRDLKNTFKIDGIDLAMRTIGLSTGSSITMSTNARYFDREGNPVTLRQLEERQWKEPHTVALITKNGTVGIEARLIDWPALVQPGPNQVIMGSIADIYRGFWVSSQPPTIGPRTLNGVLSNKTLFRTPDGQRIPQAHLDWGVTAEMSGVVARDEFILREIVVQNFVRPFEITTRINTIQPYGWMSFDAPAPFYAATDIKAIDHFGETTSLQLLSDLLQRVDLKVRITFGNDRNSDGSASVTKIEAFRPTENIPVNENQKMLEGARIKAYENPSLIFPQNIDGAQFNKALEVIDVTGAKGDARLLSAKLPVRIFGWIINKPSQNNPELTERLVRIHRIEILGSERTTYRGILAEVRDNKLYFRQPQSFYVPSSTDLREETGRQIDFVTLSARMRSEGGLRLHIGTDKNSAQPRLWWARVLRTGDPEPSFQSDSEYVATFTTADETRRTITPAAIPPIALASGTRVVNLSGETLGRDVLKPDTKLTVEVEHSSAENIAIQVRIEAVPKTFTFTTAIQGIDRETRVVHFYAPGKIHVADQATIKSQTGEPLSLNDLIYHLKKQEPRLLRITMTPDSPTDEPIVEAIEILDFDLLAETTDLQLIVAIDDPGAHIYTSKRIIELRPLPDMALVSDAEITGLGDQKISLSDVPDKSRVTITGHDTEDRIVVTALKVLGFRAESGEGILVAVDVENRILTPAPQPSQLINRQASFTGHEGKPITLRELSAALIERPEAILITTRSTFDNSIITMKLVDRKTIQQPHADEHYFVATKVSIDVENYKLTFKADPPVRVVENAPITGPNGQSWNLSDLKPGMHLFVRGFSLSEEDFLITAIFVRPQIDSIHLQPQVIAANNDGIENDVKINVVDQNGNVLSNAFQMYINHQSPINMRSGHIVHNLIAGPHIINIKTIDKPEWSDHTRVFISARGTAFKITEIVPASNATHVPTTTSISVTFNEPIYHIGDYVAIEGDIYPSPVEDEEGEPELANEGRTLIFHNVKLQENTPYTIAIFSATSASGNILSQTFRSRFSTGSALSQPGGLSGVVSLSETARFIGTAYVFTKEGEPVSEMPLSERGSFAFADINAGNYRLFVKVHTTDGRSAETFWDADQNGLPDDIALTQGEFRSNLNITLALPNIPPQETDGHNEHAQITFDLNGTPGNQAQQNREAQPGAEINVAVYAQKVSDLIGYEVTLGYHSEHLIFQGVDTHPEEVMLLRQNGGLAVFLPPQITRQTITFAGAILGATEKQAVSGDGLIGIFRFRTKEGFNQATDLTITHLVLQSRTGANALTSTAKASIAPGRSKPEDVPNTGNTQSPIVLDLNQAPGDQGMRQSAKPGKGQKVTVDIAATSGARGLAGYQVVLTHDPVQLIYDGFAVADLFSGAAPIVTQSGNQLTISVAFLGTGPTRADAGSLGQVTFKTSSTFAGATTISLTSAQVSTPDLKTTRLNTGGTVVTIGGAQTIGPDFDSDGQIGFTDFILFAQAFGKTKNDAAFDTRFDLDSDGQVGFTDFITFAQAFGKPAGKPVRATKVLGATFNSDLNVLVHTKSKSEVDLVLSFNTAIQGYGFALTYDPSAMAFVGATNMQPSLFASANNVAIITEQTPGTLQISDVLQTATEGNADLLRLHFRTRDPSANSQIDISQALIADPSGQIHTLGAYQTDVRALPKTFTLEPNYPNPFNPETVIPYALPESATVRIAVYNTLGQEIRLLSEGSQEAGFHRVVWDGKDQTGHTIASGIYFVRLQADNFSSVRKMTLLK